MAKNDTVIIDGILDDRVASKLPSEKRDEAFEYFAIEQILKDANLSKDDVLLGLIDGRNDGGIDGFYIFVNGHLLTDSQSFFWPRTNTELEVYIITCKHHDTFKQAILDNMAATLSEILDLSIEKKNLRGEYNEELLKSRELLKSAYRKLSTKIETLSFKIVYASRGDTTNIGESIIARGEQIKQIAEQSFGACVTTVLFLGSAELVALSRKVPNFTLELPFFDVLAKGERYVLLSRIRDYYNFICDDSSKLRRYLFDSNVRDFMGLNHVNDDIKATLENENSPDFWWLNNGVTILGTSARVVGNTIQVEDIQIINGLQTTESIYKYFKSGRTDPNERSILVKIIVSKEGEVRDSIIRATNNQTNVELSSLHATDKIQRDIEDILLRYGLYYERRINHYANQGVDLDLIFTPLYLASGYVNLILKAPFTATRLKSKFMRSTSSYQIIFSEKTPIEVWPKIAKILKNTDSFLEKHRLIGQPINERFLKTWRQLTSFLTISRILRKFDFDVQDLIMLEDSKITNSEIHESWKFIRSCVKNTTDKRTPQRKAMTLRILKNASVTFNISGYNCIGNWSYFSSLKKNITLDEEFVAKVNQLLPEQPWKPGIHLIIAKELKCDPSQVFKAIGHLVSKGIRHLQRNGVVYDSSGQIIAFDFERFDPNNTEVKELDS